MARLKRTNTGAVTRGGVRRKLRESDPGSVVVLTEGTRLSTKKIGGNRHRARQGELLQAGLRVDSTMGVDLDMRKLAYYVQTALAHHVKLSHEMSVRPDSGAPLPEIKHATLKNNYRRKGGYGVNTGKLLSMWGKAPVTGTVLKATAKIKPAATHLDKGRSIFINDSLRRGIDFLSAKGRAADVIQIAVDQFMSDAMTTSKGIVFTPKSIPRWSGWAAVDT